MAITTRIETDIRIHANKVITATEWTIVEQDGVEIARSPHVDTIDPAHDATAKDPREVSRPQDVMDAVSLFHTPSVKAARQAFLATQE